MITFLVMITFGAVFLLVFGTNLLIADLAHAHRIKVRKRLEGENRARHHQLRTRRFTVRKSLYKPGEDSSDDAIKLTLWEKFTRLVDESGLLVPPAQVAAICGVLGLVALAAVRLRFHNWFAAGACGCLVAWLPILYVSQVRRRRLSKLLSQLPEAFDLMSRAMRAGQTISQAMQSVADDLPAPVADEFGYCCDQQNLGLSPEAAMRGLARRTGILEIKIFVLSVMVHRQTGGNLSELLDKLSKVIRERYKVRGSIKSLTAEGRMQMLILLALPPLVFLVLLFLNRPYIALLFDYPTVLAGALGGMALGAVSMHRIIHFDF